MTLELTTKFRGISTSKSAKTTYTVADAISRAKANLRYIDRPSAVAARATAGLVDDDGNPIQGLREQCRAMRRAVEERAAKGGKNGSRVAEKIIFSLPNSWTPEQSEDVLNRLVQHFAPEGSEAKAFGVLHNDKPGNNHGHLLVVDGAESRESALARAKPGAQRIRRRDQVRLGDRGRPKQVRKEIADLLNAYAKENGIEGVEWRTKKERGLGEAMKHEGPQRRARISKSGHADAVSNHNEGIRALRAKEDQELSIFLNGSLGVQGDDLDGIFGPASESDKKKADKKRKGKRGRKRNIHTVKLKTAKAINNTLDAILNERAQDPIQGDIER